MSTKPPELARVLGLWDATCVVIGAIIGVGIFFTPRDVAHITGGASAAMLAWAGRVQRDRRAHPRGPPERDRGREARHTQ